MYVIAGASGRTGRAVAETLLSSGKQVRLIVRDDAWAAALRARGAEVCVASLDDRHALERALAGATGFYTLLPEDLTAPDFHGHRMRMADAMAAAVRGARVTDVVFLSAAAAVLADGNGPAKDLHYAENALRASGARLTAIRAAYFQDNVVGFAGPAAAGGVYPCFVPSADFAFPTVATRDVARLAARCLVETPARSEIVDLIGPAYSVRAMADELGRAIGRTLGVVVIPPDAQVEMLVHQASLPRAFAEALAEMFACIAAGRITPGGDRVEHGSTELAQVLRATVGVRH